MDVAYALSATATARNLITRGGYDWTKRDPTRVVDEGSDEVAQAAGRRSATRETRPARPRCFNRQNDCGFSWNFFQPSMCASSHASRDKFFDHWQGRSRPLPAPTRELGYVRNPNEI